MEGSPELLCIMKLTFIFISGEWTTSVCGWATRCWWGILHWNGCRFKPRGKYHIWHAQVTPSCLLISSELLCDLISREFYYCIYFFGHWETWYFWFKLLLHYFWPCISIYLLANFLLVKICSSFLFSGCNITTELWEECRRSYMKL